MKALRSLRATAAALPAPAPLHARRLAWFVPTVCIVLLVAFVPLVSPVSPASPVAFAALAKGAERDPGSSSPSDAHRAELVPSALARRAYWVFLAPRDERASKRILAEAAHRLASPRALARRARRGTGVERALSTADLPVDRAARAAVLATGVRLRAESRWLHAISVEATPAESARIAALPEVIAMRPVASSTLRAPIVEDAGGSSRHGARKDSNARGELDYGASRAQLAQIGITTLHERGLSGAGIMIGILDTGFDHPHKAFASTRIAAQRDFVFGDDDVSDEQGEAFSGHGTAVFSLIGAFDPGEMIGAAYAADFVLAKTEDLRSETQVEEDYWIAGLEWADSLGADVVSSSLGYNGWYTYAQMNGETALVTRAAALAAQRGVVVVNAMGNEGGVSWRHMIAPADAEAVISVGAVDAAGALANFSSVGPSADGRTKPDVVALGVSNVTARASARTQLFYISTLSGTSFSAPLVAGAAALVLEAHPDYSPLQVQLALRESAARCAMPDTLRGWGLVRAAVAVDHVNPGSGCDTAAVDTTTSEPPIIASLLTRPAGDLFVPSRGDLGWTFAMPIGGRLIAKVFDPAGRVVATLVDGDFPASDVPIPWDGRAGGEDVAAGIYLARVESPARTETARLVLLR